MDEEANGWQRLTDRERGYAALLGVLLLVGACALVVNPPNHLVAISGCTPAGRVNCVVSTDGDLGTFATAFAAFGVAALLIALLGIRFTKFSAGGLSVETNFESKAAGLPKAGLQAEVSAEPEKHLESVQIEESHSLAQRPFSELSSQALNSLRDARYAESDYLFLTHILGDPEHKGQQFRAALFVVGHKREVTPDTVSGATMFLGKSWRSRTFEASWSDEGQLGLVVEGFGSFLVVCEVRLKTGERVVVQDYVVGPKK
jgi:hypothetical protein